MQKFGSELLPESQLSGTERLCEFSDDLLTGTDDEKGL